MLHEEKKVTLATYNVHGLAVNTGAVTELIRFRKHSGTYGNVDATGAVPSDTRKAVLCSSRATKEKREK